MTYHQQPARTNIMTLSETPRTPESAGPDQLPTNADSPADDILVVYGTTWCGDCYRTKRFLDRNSVPYRWVDADEVPGASELIQAINRGRRTVPTLVFPDGTTMSEPSNSDLARKLGIGSS
jgi:mycoredoxin